jgi:hypothetical protein
MDYASYMIFSSHEIGQIKAFFSEYQRYNDSDVSVSISPGYYDFSITVNAKVNKGDYWCRASVNDALRFIADHIAHRCRRESGTLPITLELYTD